MKLSEAWLEEWVKPKLSREKLCDALTMAGLEVEEAAPVAFPLTHVVTGQIVRVQKHPESERLHICEVNVGKSAPLSIVCGAANVKENMKVAVATIGAMIGKNAAIECATIKGVASEGMLCSASELGLSEDNEGILELSADAPLGVDLKTYLQLDDYTIDIGITPNRGDCLSIKGLAREVSALTGAPLTPVKISAQKATIKDKLNVTTDPQGCPHYVGRVIRHVKADAITPVWMKERLRRSGIRSISAIVDVTNYVMLELGQPMHAFDLNTIKSSIQVRLSKKTEKINLLDGSEKELDDKTLVIADAEKALAIAGVMGGLDSSVTLLTTDIFLESAYFSPSVVAASRQRYDLSSDSAYRFERGVDPAIQVEAIERATQLILEIAGGEAGPVVEESAKKELPVFPVIKLSKDKISAVLGLQIPDSEIEAIFTRLGFEFTTKKAATKEWEVQVPSFRSDLNLPEDLIEEIARLYGYDKIPVHSIKAVLNTDQSLGSKDLHTIRQCLSDQDYHEIISYSFVNQKLKTLLDPEAASISLLNPISNDMLVMRTNLFPGLVNTMLYNKARQQQRIRLFEIGTCFVNTANGILQQPRLGGLITGLVNPEQWGAASREADFYDLKGNVETLLKVANLNSNISFKPDFHPALHPGQTAGIYCHNQRIGIIGALHPIVLQQIDILSKIYVFELDLNVFAMEHKCIYQEVSRFPEIRRDIAILVNQAIPAEDIQDTINSVAGDWLKDIFIFDVYQGKGISAGLKSVALGLILQHPSRTLVDNEVAELMERIVAALQGKLGAQLRS